MIRRVLLPVLVAFAATGCGGGSDSKQPKIQNPDDAASQKLKAAPPPSAPGAPGPKGAPTAGSPQ
ncbi:MAG: hypothetical protein JWO38_7103 [Gemmataceae bacterium]|nr:hypothetical protein [Gemmataceae bacterium]